VRFGADPHRRVVDGGWAALMRFEIAYGKAFGALALNRSSRQVLQKAREKPAFMESLAEGGYGPYLAESLEPNEDFTVWTMLPFFTSWIGLLDSAGVGIGVGVG